MTFPEFPNSEIPSAGELALEDRTALRRVAGLSTELTDVSEVEYRQLRLERVVLVGVWTEGSAADAEASLAELAALAETAGSEVLDGLVQRRDKPDAVSEETVSVGCLSFMTALGLSEYWRACVSRLCLV